MIKKSFFIGLMLFAIVLGFSSCKSAPKITERHFVATSEKGFSIGFTEYYENGIFAGRETVDKISFGENLYIINKNCSLGPSFIGKFASINDDVTSEQHNFYWVKQDIWSVNCYDLGIQIGKELLSDIEFGWCNCSCNQGSGQHFVISTKTYYLDDQGGIGGNTYFATLEEVK